MSTLNKMKKSNEVNTPCYQTLVIDHELHFRLADEAINFETPSQVIKRILDFHSKEQAFGMLRRAVESKKLHFLEEGYLRNFQKSNATILMHYPHELIQEAYEKIILSFPELDFLHFNISGLVVEIEFNPRAS